MASDKAYYDPRSMGRLPVGLLLLLVCFVIPGLWQGTIMRGCFSCPQNHPNLSLLLLQRKGLKASQQGTFQNQKIFASLATQTEIQVKNEQNPCACSRRRLSLIFFPFGFFFLRGVLFGYFYQNYIQREVQIELCTISERERAAIPMVQRIVLLKVVD